MVHSKHLDILNSRITRGKTEVDLMEVLPMEHKKNEFLVFRTSHNVPPGDYTIHIGMMLFILGIYFAPCLNVIIWRLNIRQNAKTIFLHFQNLGVT